MVLSCLAPRTNGTLGFTNQSCKFLLRHLAALPKFSNLLRVGLPNSVLVMI